MDAQPSLDQILQEIRKEKPTTSSAGVSDIETHLATQSAAAPALYTPADTNAAQRQDNATDTAHLLSSGLPERQRKLPKIDFRMIGGIIAVMLLMVGVGTATVLTGQSQELRQRAYEAPATIRPIPEFQQTETPAAAPAEMLVPQSNVPSILNILLMAGGVVVIIGLVAFFFWAFLV